MGWLTPLIRTASRRGPRRLACFLRATPRPRLRTRIRPHDGVFAPVGTSRSRRHRLHIHLKRLSPTPSVRRRNGEKTIHHATSRRLSERTARNATSRRLFALRATDRRRRRETFWARASVVAPTSAGPYRCEDAVVGSRRCEDAVAHPHSTRAHDRIVNAHPICRWAMSGTPFSPLKSKRSHVGVGCGRKRGDRTRDGRGRQR
jgi:hypothetical protein